MSLTAPAPGKVCTTDEPELSMARRVGGNSLWLIARPLTLNVISIASNIYIVRELGAADYGAFNLGFAQVALFAPLCNLGLRAVAVRAIAQDREQAPALVGALHALRILLTGLALLLLAGWLCLPTYSLTTRLIGAAAACSMVCTSMSATAIDLFQGFERSRLAAQPQMVGGLLLTLCSVAALLAGWGLGGFVAAYVLGAALQTALLHGAAARELFKIRPCWNWSRMRELGLQARPFAFLSLMSNVTDVPVLDVLILGAVYGSGAVGPYTAALGLVMRLLMIPYGIGDALYPAVASGYREQREEVLGTLRRCILNLALITVPAAIGLSFFAPTLIRILYGEEYGGAATALRLLGWLLPLMGVNYLMRESLSAIHRQDQVVRLTLVSFGVMVAFYGVLIPLFGITGAALAGVLREAVMLLLWSRAFGTEFKDVLPWERFGRLSLAIGVLCVPLALACGSGLAGVVVGGVLGTLVYAVLLLKLGLLDLTFLLRR